MTGVITWVVDCGDGECIERGRPSNAVDLMMNNPDLYSLTFNTDQNETTDGSKNTGGSDLYLASVLGSQKRGKALGVELTRAQNTSPEEKLESSQVISESNDPSGDQKKSYRRYIEYGENDKATSVETHTYVDEDGNTVTVTIRTPLSNGDPNASEEDLEPTTTMTRTYVDENGETVTETLVYRNGELVGSSTSSGADEGTEGVPGQQNSDADSNDVVTGMQSSYVESKSDGIEAITVLLEPAAVGGKDQIDLILNYDAFDGASMTKTYEATRANAYSQQHTLASAIEAPKNEMNYMLDASQNSSITTDESENLMFAAMITIETVGL